MSLFLFLFIYLFLKDFSELESISFLICSYIYFFKMVKNVNLIFLLMLLCLFVYNVFLQWYGLDFCDFLYSLFLTRLYTSIRTIESLNIFEILQFTSQTSLSDIFRNFSKSRLFRYAFSAIP